MVKRTPFLLNLFVLIVLVGLAFGLNPVSERASAQSTDNKAILYFFWGNGCPHCAEADPVLKDMVKRYPQMEVRAYEVWYNQDNQALFQKMGTAFGFKPDSVPGIFLGDKYWVGYASDIGTEIESAVSACVQNGCKDAGAGVVSGGVFDTWTAAGIISGKSTDWASIVGLAVGVVLLGLLIFFVILPLLGINIGKKKLTKSARRRRRAGSAT